MPPSRSSKSRESSHQSPSSSEDADAMIRILGGGKIEPAKEIGKTKKSKDTRGDSSWSDFVPVEKSEKAPSDFTASDLLQMIREGIQRRFKLYPQVRIKHAYTQLADLREMLKQRFPHENEFALTVEYIEWYLRKRSDSDVAKSGKWRLSMLIHHRSVAMFCSARDSAHGHDPSAVVSPSVSRLPLDEETLTKRLQQPLEDFVADYGPIIPFAVLQRKINLFEHQAGVLVVQAVKNLVGQGRASYDSVAKSMSAYGPYPAAVAGMGASMFVDAMSEECHFDFSPFLSFMSVNDQG